MIDGRYATYRGETYKVVEIVSNEVLLVTEDEQATEHGFEAQTANQSNSVLLLSQDLIMLA